MPLIRDGGGGRAKPKPPPLEAPTVRKVATSVRQVTQALRGGGEVRVAPAVLQSLLPEVTSQFINRWTAGGGTVTTTAPQNLRPGPAGGLTRQYTYPGFHNPGQTLGPLGAGFGNVLAAPSPSANPIFVTGRNISQLRGNLLHEMYHAFQRQRPWLRAGMVAEMIGGQPYPGEYAAFRLSNRQVTGNRQDWVRYGGFLR